VTACSSKTSGSPEESIAEIAEIAEIHIAEIAEIA
jgi:hypothetical protein